MKNYFPGLDGLRFIAATAVLIHHVELLKGDNGYSNLWRTQFFTNIGPLSVTFFFVLSGFLISYLLLKEKNATQSISLSSFYFRRVLRILPLYYLIVILSFLVLPHYSFFDQPFFTQRLHESFSVKLAWFLALMPQVVFILFDNAPVPYGVQAWSIGVEEQFYIAWPFAIKKMNNVLILFVSVFIGFAIAPVIFATLKSMAHDRLSDSEKVFWFAQRYVETVRFSCMAVGGMLAYCVINKKNKILSILYHQYVQIFAYILLGVLLIRGYPFRYFKHEIFSALFGILIINASSNNSFGIQKTFSKLLNSPVFDFMGKRSYGIYMYHMIGIQIAINIYQYFFTDTHMNMAQNVFLYVLALGFTFTISMLSYALFEKRLLSLRKKQEVLVVKTDVIRLSET